MIETPPISGRTLSLSRDSSSRPNSQQHHAKNGKKMDASLSKKKRHRRKQQHLRLTYKLKPDSPFHNFTTPKTCKAAYPEKISERTKSSWVHGKLSSNPIFQETKAISAILHPPPEPKYYSSFLDSTIPRTASSGTREGAWGGEEDVVPFSGEEPTPLELLIRQSVKLRESYLGRLRALTQNKRNRALLNDSNESIHTLTEDAQILMVEVGDLLTLIRHSTIEFVEQVDKWRQAHDNHSKPFLVDGKNYLAGLSSDLNFLDDFYLLSKWLGTRMTRNPLVLRNGFDERLESLRDFEGLPPIMLDVKYADEGSGEAGDENDDLITNENGTKRRGGLVEKMRMREDEPPPPSSPSLEKSPAGDTGDTNNRANDDGHAIVPERGGDGTIHAENAIKIGSLSLAEDKPRDIAMQAIKEANLALRKSNEQHDNESKIPSPSKHAKATPTFYRNATTFQNPSTSIALRFLRCERIILHEEAIYSPGSLSLALKSIEMVPPFIVPPPPPHDPFHVDEDKVIHKLKIIDQSLRMHNDYALKVEGVIKKQVSIIPSLRLQLYWSRRVREVMEDQRNGEAVGESVLEKLPWTTGDIDAQFHSAWSSSAKFRCVRLRHDGIIIAWNIAVVKHLKIRVTSPIYANIYTYIKITCLTDP